MNIRHTLGKILYSIINIITLKKNNVKHNNFTINGIIKILNFGTLTLGDNFQANSGKNKNPIGGDTIARLIVFKKNAVLTIGENFRMSNSTIVCWEKIEIGNNVMIGGSCKIWDTDFHSLIPDIRMANEEDNDYKTAPIIIKDNVFIGAGVIILKGVTIGENSIIGAGSVVTGNVAENEIWAGNPARFIKSI